MVSIRFTSFLLGFLLFSVADSHHGLEKILVAGVNPPPATGRVPGTLNKENFGTSVPAAEVKNGGRKMMLKREMVEAEAGGYGGAHFAGNCKHKGEGMLNVEGKFSNRSPHPAVKVRMGGFIAFSADYHVPKPHPPKNN